ncbi:MAG: hypothetical protein Q7N95_18560 [Alphaproteobacteria bacterium]|nr:hypothetical protein [Alphaproteobacteria bacterium]
MPQELNQGWNILVCWLYGPIFLMKNRVPRHNQKLTRLFLCNAEADGELLQRVAQPDAAGKGLLAQATQGLKLSVRASYHRMARTLADMEGVEQVTRLHIAEALSYRRLDLGQ